jgi:hypothetical protein
LLPSGKQRAHPLTAALQPPKDRRSCLLHGASTRFALPAASPTWATLALAHRWWAFMPSNHIGGVALDLVGYRHNRLFFTIPSRSAVVICYTSLSLRDNSCAMCSVDTLISIQYRHKLHIFSG